ncbi:MAG: hypothetical protein IPH35_22540 [Rhodoferax sp.]|nr:hypothetical protein [Rhodoferax sp.]
MSHFRDWSVRVLSGLLLLCATSVLADVEPSPVRISGYGTLSYSWDNDAQLTLIRDITQRPQDDYSTGGTWKLDSRIGLQASYQHSPQVGALAQLVLRDQTRQEANDLVELAYLDLQPSDYLRLRVGRIGYDAFLMSDHRNLGYAYAWVRPPTEFYGWIPIFSLDGADLTHEWNTDDARWRVRAQAGTSKVWIPMGDTNFRFKGDSLWSLSVQREGGPWRLKAGLSGFVSGAEVPNLEPLYAGLEQIAAVPIPSIAREAVVLRNEMRFGDAQLRYATLGLAYDDGNWLMQTEFGRTWTDTAMTAPGWNGYGVVGRRIHAWTPYVMLSASRPQGNVLAPLNDWSVIGQRAFQTTAYRISNTSRADQTTLAVGTRWDVHPRAAIKFQWENTRIEPMGYAQWFRGPGIFERSSQVNIFTVGMDFLF